MYRAQIEVDEGPSSGPVHHQRVDSTHAPSILPIGLRNTKQESGLRVRWNCRTASEAHLRPAPDLNHPHQSPQVPPIRGTNPQQNPGRSSRPYQDTLVPQVTYDRYRHNSRLRVINLASAAPSHTVHEVWALHGEPNVKPRQFNRPSRSQKLQVNNPDEPQRALDDGSGPFKPLDPHQQITDSAEDGTAQGMRFRANCAEISGSAVIVGSLGRTVAQSFELIRRGSGKRAKIRRGIEDLLGIKHD